MGGCGFPTERYTPPPAAVAGFWRNTQRRKCKSREQWRWRDESDAHPILIDPTSKRDKASDPIPPGRWVLTVEAAGVDVPVTVGVRRLLKAALRCYGLRCIDVREKKLDDTADPCNNYCNESQAINERLTPRSAEASALPERHHEANGHKKAIHDEISPPGNIPATGPGRQTGGVLRH